MPFVKLWCLLCPCPLWPSLLRISRRQANKQVGVGVYESDVVVGMGRSRRLAGGSKKGVDAKTGGWSRAHRITSNCIHNVEIVHPGKVGTEGSRQMS